MPDNTIITPAMTPDKLLEQYDWAVIRFGYDNRPLVSNLFSLESTAIESADDMNQYAKDPDDEYSVIRIEHDTDIERERLESNLNAAISDAERLESAMRMICNYIESECEKLRDRHANDSYGDMTHLDHYRYEMDREAHSTMSAIYALISGATLGEYGGMMGSFPIPDFDD